VILSIYFAFVQFNILQVTLYCG